MWSKIDKTAIFSQGIATAFRADCPDVYLRLRARFKFDCDFYYVNVNPRVAVITSLIGYFAAMSLSIINVINVNYIYRMSIVITEFGYLFCYQSETSLIGKYTVTALAND